MLTPFNPAYNSIPLPANKYERDPEYEEATPVCRCSECGDGIYEDEQVWVFGDKVFCETCTEAHNTTAERGKLLNEQTVRQENKRRAEAWKKWWDGYEASR